MAIRLEPALPRHRPALEALLLSVHLPIEDLPADLGGFTLAFDGDRLVGSAGLERLGSYGLLRSVAVDAAFRGTGLGASLYLAALDTARAAGLREIWLLTTSAEGYFAQRGFERIDRAEAPPEIQAAPQFAGVCPASAVLMRLSV